MEKCKYHKKELRPLNPPVEDYLEYKFCFKIFDWKLMLLKDKIEYGCVDCQIEEEQQYKDNDYEQVYNQGRQDGYEKGLNENF